MRILSLRAALAPVAIVASVAIVTFATFVSGASSAQADGPEDPPKAPPGPISPTEAAAKSQALEAEVLRAFAQKRYEDAAKMCREQIALTPGSQNPRYNLACALSRLGMTKEALESLKAAIERGYSEADHMLKDADLANLAGEKEFGELVAAARAAEVKAEERAYEPGAAIEDVKSIEGSPANGLRWRLRIGKDATAEKPHRLVVWLHPSGGSMNATA